MKIRYGKLAATFGALLLALVCAPSSWAGCAPSLAESTHSSWMVQPGGPTLLQVALEEDKNYREPSIVGFWHFKQVSGIECVRCRLRAVAQRRNRDLQLGSAGAGSPAVSAWACGSRSVRVTIGLNHRAIGWDAWRNDARLCGHDSGGCDSEPNGNSFSGSYIVNVYDLSGHFLQVVSKGKVTAERASQSRT